MNTVRNPAHIYRVLGDFRASLVIENRARAFVVYGVTVDYSNAVLLVVKILLCLASLANIDVPHSTQIVSGNSEWYFSSNRQSNATTAGWFLLKFPINAFVVLCYVTEPSGIMD